VEGFIPISHLAIPKLEHSEEAFHAGEELPLKVIELDMENRRLILSVKAFFFSRDPKLQEEYIALHEQYMRERIARLQKKRAERQARDKQKEETTVPQAEEAETPAEAANEDAAETGENVEAPLEETGAEETAVEETVETVTEEVPVEEPVVEETTEATDETPADPDAKEN